MSVPLILWSAEFNFSWQIDGQCCQITVNMKTNTTKRQTTVKLKTTMDEMLGNDGTEMT